MTGRRALVILLAAAAAVLAGGAGGGTGGPLTLLAGTSGGGQALGDVEPTGVEVPFLERGRFWLAVQIRNDSGEAVTVVDARTPEPAKSLVRQTATRLGLSPQCVLGPCDFMPEGIEAKPLAPVAVPPGGLLGVRLEYRVGTCADAARASYASGDELVVDYRDGAGALQRQSFPIGRLRLIVRKPAGVDCVPRPFSHLGLVGSFTTSPGHLPDPGSDGDTCTRDASGALRYTSRYFRDRGGIRWRVEIVFPHFAGKGTYKTSSRPPRTGPAQVTVTGAFGDGPGFSVFQAHPGSVSVTQATGTLFGGRLNATLSGKRRFFSAYGAWRCTTKLS